jgi:hypothetical protein
MAGKANPLGKPVKKKATAARKKSAKKPAKRSEPERDLDAAIKSGREIKGEIPEALAYFLEVYGRLGRG